MMEKISAKTKKIGIYLLMLLIVYLAYVLSFKKAIAALVLNSQLKELSLDNGLPASAFAQLERKHSFYLSVLKGYRVGAEDRESRLWQSVSGTAIASGTSISFSPEENKVLADTSAADSSLFFDSFTFSGEYRSLAHLLDTISRSKGIGRISFAKISKQSSALGDVAKEKLVLKLKMAAVTR